VIAWLDDDQRRGRSASALVHVHVCAANVGTRPSAWGRTEAEMDAILERIDRDRGRDALLDLSDPSIADNDEARRSSWRWLQQRNGRRRSKWSRRVIIEL